MNESDVYTITGRDANGEPATGFFYPGGASWGDGWEVATILATAGIRGTVDGVVTIETVTTPDGAITYNVKGDAFVPGATKTRLDTAHAKATAYAWGRQDNGSEDHDTDAARAFANAYATRQLMWDTGKASTMPNLRDAYDDWRETGKVL